MVFGFGWELCHSMVQGVVLCGVRRQCRRLPNQPLCATSGLTPPTSQHTQQQKTIKIAKVKANGLVRVRWESVRARLTCTVLSGDRADMQLCSDSVKEECAATLVEW